LEFEPKASCLFLNRHSTTSATSPSSPSLDRYFFYDSMSHFLPWLPSHSEKMSKFSQNLRGLGPPTITFPVSLPTELHTEPASEPLHLLFLLPGVLFPLHPKFPLLSFIRYLSKCHLRESFSDHSIEYCYPGWGGCSLVAELLPNIQSPLVLMHSITKKTNKNPTILLFYNLLHN
jgi:hypothetical protein